jgi:DNA-binding transcriptional LysR family regulator
MNFRTLDLNLLRVLDEVLSEKSLTRASRNLAMTQPAVSNALKRLRDVLGDELVIRSGYGVVPTPFAERIWPSVRQALAQLQLSLGAADFNAAQSQATFVLAMADATAAELMPSLARTLREDAPGIRVRVLPLLTRDPRKLLASEDIDLACGYFPAVLADLSKVAFEHQRLFDGEYVCVMRKGHPLAKPKALTLDAYCAADHLLVSFSGKPFGFVDEALAAQQRKRRVVMTVNQFFTAGRVVAQSDMLTVLPRHFVSVANAAGDLVQRALPIDVPTVHVDALWHHRKSADAAHAWLRQAIVRAATSMTPASLK